LEESERVKLVKRADGIFYELYIAGVVPEDSGEYKCVAINDLGSEECVASIAVVGELISSITRVRRLSVP
jgi:hypothetical protein